MYRLRCYTLFNITHTGVSNRSRPTDTQIEDWLKKRNTQCNFDTILQVISLRSQPEVIKLPSKISLSPIDYFGFGYGNEEVEAWYFDFEVQHPSVFVNNDSEMGALYRDCERVPMLTDSEQLDLCPPFLNTSVELKNIHFEVL